MSYLHQLKATERKQLKAAEHSYGSIDRIHPPHQTDLVHNMQALHRTVGNQAVTHLLQRMQHSPTLANDVPLTVHDGLISPKQPLDGSMLAFREPQFGQEFSRIPIHTSRAGVIQTKLAINKPGDEYKKEADQIADQVLAAPVHHTSGIVPPRIQRYIRQASEFGETVPISVDHSLVSSGRQLDPATRQDMEQRFGHDFSQVRVHSSEVAEWSAREMNANAYTVGHNIAFGAGQYKPGTHEGRRLIAHELTHVVQQSRSHAILLGQRNESPDQAIGTATGEGKQLSTHGFLHV